MLSYCNTFAQSNDFNCNFVADPLSTCDTEFSARIDLEWLDNFDPVVVNVFFWELKDSNGNIQTGDYNPDWNFEKESLDVIAELNIYYNPYKIFFKYKGTGEIHNDVLYEAANNFSTVLNGLVAGTSTPEDYKKPDAINAYVTPAIEGGAAPIFGRRYLIGRESFDIRLNVSTHEVGHNFGLLHTHAYWFNCSDTGLPIEFLAENVTRSNTDDDYNADTNGDRVPDTAASPDLKFQYCEELGYNYPSYVGCNGGNYFEYMDEEGCSYIDDDYLDCVGGLYVITDEDVRNIMSYAPNECKDIFTIGQGIRMREAIETSCTAGENGLQSAINPDGIASLYEPYKGEYYFAGPLPVDLEGNLNPPLYQPGFDYSFVSCDCLATNDCPLPLDYGDTGFTYNEQVSTFISKTEGHHNIITHPNHTAIDILILDESQPWRCYDNNNRRPNGGTIIKFNDNVFNTNVTITPQDSTSINDENLINNLEPGLYNIIEQYQEGDTEEKVIIKENN